MESNSNVENYLKLLTEIFTKKKKKKCVVVKDEITHSIIFLIRYENKLVKMLMVGVAFSF